VPGDDDIKLQLRGLRDRLALEVPRAHARYQAPPELMRRLLLSSETAARVFQLLGPSGAVPDDLEEAATDAIVEARLALEAWAEWCGRPAQAPRPHTTPVLGTPLGGADRRQHERHEIAVTVRLLRHVVREGAPRPALDIDSASRPARNVSLGGISVIAGANDLSQVGLGSVLHVLVGTGPRSFNLRGVVTRRDATGIALQWIAESAGEKRTVQELVETVRGGKPK
jgi:hypothetical protein